MELVGLESPWLVRGHTLQSAFVIITIKTCCLQHTRHCRCSLIADHEQSSWALCATHATKLQSDDDEPAARHACSFDTRLPRAGSAECKTGPGRNPHLVTCPRRHMAGGRDAHITTRRMLRRNAKKNAIALSGHTGQWVVKETIQFIAKYVTEHLPMTKRFSLCHGTRSGREALWFRESLPGIQVWGTRGRCRGTFIEFVLSGVVQQILCTATPWTTRSTRA